MNPERIKLDYSHDVCFPDDGKRHEIIAGDHYANPAPAEILSPAAIENDRKLKRDVYERSQVPEYWVVDPFEYHVDQLVLQEGKYHSQSSAEQLELSIIENISIDLLQVW